MNAEWEKEITERFRYACKGLDYERMVVLGGILGEVMSALVERDREVEIRNGQYEHLRTGAESLQEENKRLRKALERLGVNPDEE